MTAKKQYSNHLTSRKSAELQSQGIYEKNSGRHSTTAAKYIKA